MQISECAAPLVIGLRKCAAKEAKGKKDREMPVGPLASVWIHRGRIHSGVSWLGAGSSSLAYTSLVISLQRPPERGSLV